MKIRPLTEVLACQKYAKKNSVALVRERIILSSDRRLSVKLMPTFADRGCRVVSALDPHSLILGFLDQKNKLNIITERSQAR
jgi:hypothetical protein